MEPNRSNEISALPDDQLNEFITNRQKYSPDTVEAAISALQQRGNTFTEAEFQEITTDNQIRRENAARGSKGSSSLFNNDYKHCLVDDPYVPMLYSKRALFVFTVLCSAIFGSIMLAVNLGKLRKTGAAIGVILLGFAFTTVQVIISNRINSSSSLAYLFGLIAAYCIDYLLWPRFVGEGTFYRAKPIWVPLIIAVVLIGGLICVAVFTTGQ